jgi:glycerol uptake facilitator-like aquaporin
MINKPKVAVLGAEFLGTAVLVMVALVLFNTTAVSWFVGTSLAITAAVVVAVFGSISGAHINPAITLGMWTARKIGTIRAVGYIAAQMLGGLASWQLYQYLINHTLPARSGSFDTRIWLAEVVGTAILATGFAAAVVRGFENLQRAVVYGASYFVAIVVASTASAGLVNPAVALGLRSWSTAYVLGPLVGGIIGVNLYVYLFAPDGKKSAKKAK